MSRPFVTRPIVTRPIVKLAVMLCAVGLATAACAPATGRPPDAQPGSRAASRTPDAPPQVTVPMKETDIKGSAAESERTLAAGRAEGTVNVVTHPSLQWRGWVPIFQQRYPELKVEHLGMRPSEATPRIIAEQNN